MEELGLESNAQLNGTGGIAFSTDSKSLMLAVSAGDVVSVVSLPSYSLVHSWKLPSCIMAICFTPGGDLVVAYGTVLAVCTPDNGQERYTMEATEKLRSVCCSPNSQWIAAGSEDGHIFL